MQQPSKIGPYRVLREVGRGGLGVVYEVENEQDGRRVALKTLKLSSPHLSLRLQREFRAIARLDHNGLVHVYDYGVHEDSPYLVMDFVEGSGLAQHVLSSAEPGSPASVRLAVTLVADLCAVLDYIHSKGIIHRDLKPSNVLVDRQGTVKLIDFGLVKDADQDEALTESGIIVGTIAYLAPEQLQGRRMDARADLYALGVVLFELCTGTRPFRGENSLALLRAHLGMAPPRPSSLNPAIPPALDEVILALLEKEPHRRPTSASEVGARLRAILADSTEHPAEAPRTARHTQVPAQAPLVGRELEVRELGQSLAGAVLGAIRVLAIAGDAGMGKTRLVEEGLALWRLLGGRALQSRSHPGDRVAYGLLKPVLRSLERTNVDLSREPEGAEIVAALGEELRVMRENEPVALFLEDVHWSDPLSLDGVLQLLREAQASMGRGFAVVLSLREEASPVDALSRLLQWSRRENLLDRWNLEPLQASAASELVAALLGSAISPYFAAWLHRSTGGNPALLEGAVRHVLERGSLRMSTSGEWQLELGRGPVPLGEFEEAEGPSFLDVLGQEAVEPAKLKLAGVSPAERELLEPAALLRGEFGLQTLAGVLRLDELELLDRLDTLLRKGILAEANTEGDRFRFTMEMLRESVADGLTGPRRLLLERRIVAGLEQRHGSSPTGQVAVALAEHAHAAKLDEKALRYGFAAAAELHRGSLLRDAERIYVRIRELLENPALRDVLSTTEQLDVLEGLARVRLSRGAYEQAYADYEQFTQLCEIARDSTRLVRALQGTATAAVRLMRRETAEPLIRRIVDLCADLGDVAGLARALNLQAVLAFDRGDLPEAERRFRGAAQGFRQAASTEELTGALINTGFIIDCGGRYDEARGHFEEALALRRQAPPSLALIRSLFHLAGNAIRSGRLDSARPLVEECETLARKLGDPSGRFEALLCKARLAEAEGRHPGAVYLYQQADGAAERLDRTDYRLECRLGLCRLEALEAPARALPQAEAILAEARQAGRSQYEISAQAVLAGILADLGRPEEARQQAADALAGARRTGFCWAVPAAQAVLDKLR